MDPFTTAFSIGVFVAVLLGVYGLLIGTIASSGGERRRDLLTFAAQLNDGALVDGTLLGGFRQRVKGRLASGRQVRVTNRGSWIDYEVRIPGWTQDLDLVTRELAEETAEGARAPAQAHQARAALRELAGLLGCEVLRVRSGWLQARREAFEYAFTPGSLQRVLEHLDTAAGLYASRPVEVRVLGASAAGWTAGGEEVRCPYCHDALDPQQEDLGACAACNTVHHAECLAEAGGCTVLGCAGKAREPLRS